MIAGLVLAAGESSRMGRDKALLPYRGRTFLETIIDKLHEARIERVTVVLGHHAETIQESVQRNRSGFPDVELVINRDYRLGQTSSLQAGLAALQRPPVALSPSQAGTPDAIILCLVDHPAFDPVTVAALLAAFERTKAPVIVPTYGGRRGHPVLIAPPLFAPLLALGPGHGANSVIRAWHDRAAFVEVPDAGILMDVDDEATYQSLEKA